MTPGYAVMFLLTGALCALIGFAVAARLYGRLVDDAASTARQAMAIARRAYDTRGAWQSTTTTTEPSTRCEARGWHRVRLVPPGYGKCESCGFEWMRGVRVTKQEVANG